MKSAVIERLDYVFVLKVLGEIHHFLGIEVTKVNGEMHLCQAKYVGDLLTKAGLQNSKLSKTPMCIGQKLTKEAGGPFEDGTLHRSLIGGLQYVTITRPDISYAVSKLSQYVNNPSKPHWKTCKKILRYLRGTQFQGLILKPGDTSELIAYTDADWGCD